LKIELTETEITHIMDALDARIKDLTDTLAMAGDPMIEDEIAELTDLNMDLFEAIGRRDDGWDDPAPPVASGQLWADDMIQAGIDAREQVKASSMAAQRREQQIKDMSERKTLAERLSQGTTATLANDPIDW